VVLVFAGNGIYRFCKYRNCFTDDMRQDLRQLQSRLEVAADTLHPHWRQILTVVGKSTEAVYDGHPHDWVVADRGDPLPLARTYLQWDPNFAFEHLDNSVVDADVWGNCDPRTTTNATCDHHICTNCHELQSSTIEDNACRCFPNLYGGKLTTSPTQVFRTADGRNNGLMTCLVSRYSLP